MIFSSPLFLFAFLPIVLLVYFLTPGIRLKNLWLLAASLFFYSWGDSAYLWLLLLCIGGNWMAGLLIQECHEDRPIVCRFLFAAVLLLNLLPLFYYKYAPFFIENLALLLPQLNSSLSNPALPLGISFFTFQAMSYAIDLYRGRIKAQKNPLQLALYISMFPQLIAGPIVRYQEIAENLKSRTHRLEGIAYGFLRFMIGLGKKVLLADTFAGVVNQAYAMPAQELTAAMAWLAIIAFSGELYFDFAGYCDMAVGLGCVFGFRFPENFNYPYYATSVSQFWQRWHMTLTRWFGDYVFKPLGGYSRGRRRGYFNLLLVFALIGIWHGASWTFMFFGISQAAMMIAERVFLLRFLKTLPAFIRRIWVYLFLILTGVLFRAADMEQVLHFWRTLAQVTQWGGLNSAAFRLALSPELALILVAGLLAATPALGHLFRFNDAGKKEFVLNGLSMTGGVLVFLLALLYVVQRTYQPFIYFRF